ncbi:MAG: abortive infection protein [Candidatus Sericytochromatia bacterium]|nr:MAG: abortive infection protein [Candidatus Sericytochromatia bacterium]
MNRKEIFKILVYQELFLILLSFLWIYFKYDFIDINNIPLSNIRISLYSFLYGILLSTILLAISSLIIFTYEPLKNNIKTINELIISKLNYLDILIIAILSGIAEELLFRGLLQEKIGIILSNLIFSLLHILNKDFLVYSLLTFVAGNILGNVYFYTNDLSIVIIAHIFNNLVAMIFSKNFFKKNNF